MGGVGRWVGMGVSGGVCDGVLVCVAIDLCSTIVAAYATGVWNCGGYTLQIFVFLGGLKCIKFWVF